MYNKYDLKNACYFGEKVIFKYKNISYTIDKILNDDNYLEDNYYLYSNNTFQYFNHIDKLIYKSNIEGKSLYEVLDDVKILFIDYNTEKEFVAATIMNNEIEFEYNGINYFKSSDEKGYYIWCQKDKSFQYYSSPEELLQKGTLQGKLLKNLWKNIIIQFIF